MSEKIIEHSDLPAKLLNDVQGDVIFEQTQPKVCFKRFVLNHINTHYNINIYTIGHLPDNQTCI